MDRDKNSQFDLKHFPQSSTLVNALNEMFPEQVHEDKITQRAKEILGLHYSTEDAKCLVAAYEYLIQDWLEEHEKQVFDNKTLKELLQSF
jgi:hypothetical protein